MKISTQWSRGEGEEKGSFSTGDGVSLMVGWMVVGGEKTGASRQASSRRETVANGFLELGCALGLEVKIFELPLK